MTGNKVDMSYKPVSCELYSQYELAIMHKSELCLSWVENGVAVTKAGIIPLDIQTKNKAEFLLVKTPEQDELVIRLDQITEMHILK